MYALSAIEVVNIMASAAVITRVLRQRRRTFAPTAEAGMAPFLDDLV